MTHKINPGFWKAWDNPAPVVLDERYEGEIEKALKRAEKAYRRAAERLARAEQQPSPSTVLHDLRAEVEQRLDELNKIQALMNGPEPRGTRRSGKGAVHRVTNNGRSL